MFPPEPVHFIETPCMSSKNLGSLWRIEPSWWYNHVQHTLAKKSDLNWGVLSKNRINWPVFRTSQKLWKQWDSNRNGWGNTSWWRLPQRRDNPKRLIYINWLEVPSFIVFFTILCWQRRVSPVSLVLVEIPGFDKRKAWPFWPLAARLAMEKGD